MTRKFGAPPPPAAGLLPSLNLQQVAGAPIPAPQGGGSQPLPVQIVDNNGNQEQLNNVADAFSGSTRALGVYALLYALNGSGFYDRLFYTALSRSTSALNTQLQVAIEIRNLNQILAIISAASAGTATLQVEVSVDNVNYVSIDSLAAALIQAKNYQGATVGATVAVSPVAYRWVRITAGAAGAGNSTTLTISAK